MTNARSVTKQIARSVCDQGSWLPSKLGDKLQRHIELDRQSFPATALYDSVSESNWMTYEGTNGSVNAITDNDGNVVAMDVLSGDYFSTGTLGDLATQVSGEVFMVFRYTSGANANQTVFNFSNSGANRLQLRMRSSDLATTHVFSKAFNTSSGLDYNSAGARQKAFGVYSIHGNGVDTGGIRRSLYDLNLTSETDSEKWFNDVTGADDLTLFARRDGASSYSEDWEGHFCELIIVDELTEKERENLVMYLKEKYDVIDCMSIGDSISNNSTDWPAYLLDNSVDNNTKIGMYQFADGGAFTAAMVDQFALNVDKGWDYCFLIGGVNDCVAGTDTAVTQSNYDDIVTLARENNVKLVIGTILPFGDDSSWDADAQSRAEANNTYIKTLVSNSHVTVIDLYEYLLDAENDPAMYAYMTGDGLHPNETGGRFIATKIHNEIFPVSKPGIGVYFGVTATDNVNCGSDASLDNLLIENDVSLPRTVVSIRARIDGYGASNNGRLVAKSDTGNDGGWQIYLVDDDGTSAAIRFEHSRNSGATFTRWRSTNRIVTYGEWATFTLNLTSDQLHAIYKDGVLQVRENEASGSGAFDSDAGEDLIIGNRKDLDRPIEGRFEWVRIFKGVLDAEELLDPTTATNKQVVCYEFNEGTGDAKSSSVAPNANGTLTGAVWARENNSAVINSPFASRSDTTFTRDSISRDSEGADVPANTPRLAQTQGFITDSDIANEYTAWSSASSGIIHGCHLDFDNETEMMVVWEPSTNIVHTFLGGSFTPSYSTDFSSFGADLMKNTISGERYKLSSITVYCGLVRIVARRQDESNNDQGIALLYSTDYGQSFNIVTDADGNRTFPTVNAGVTRGTIFCSQSNWAEGKTSVGTLWTDYQFQSSADGGQLGWCVFTRTGETTTDWTTVGARLLYEITGKPSTHFHCAGVIESSKTVDIVLSIGDTTERNRNPLIVITDASDYMNCDLEINETFFGGDDTDNPPSGRRSNQFTGVAPGPDGGLLLGSDFDDQTITLMEVKGGPATEDKVGAVSPVWGTRYSENFCLVKHPTKNWYVSGDRMSGATKNFLMFSNDGISWVEFNVRDGGGVPQAQFYGDVIVHARGGVGIVALNPPTMEAARPILIGRASLENKAAGTDNWHVWTAGEAGTSLTLFEPDGNGDYLFPSGHESEGEVIPLPESRTPWYRLTSDGSNDDAGRWDLTRQTTTDTQDGAAIIQVFGLDNEGPEFRLSFDDSNSTIPMENLCNNGWVTYQVKGDVRPARSYPACRLRPRTVGNANKTVDVLITILELHTDGTAAPSGIPIDGLASTSAENYSIQSGNYAWEDWQFQAIIGVAYLAQMPIALDNPLVTIVGDNGTYLKVFRNTTITDEIATIEAELYDGTTTYNETASYPLRRLGTNAVITCKRESGQVSVNLLGADDVTINIDGNLSGDNLTMNIGANEDFTEVGLCQGFRFSYQ